MINASLKYSNYHSRSTRIGRPEDVVVRVDERAEGSFAGALYAYILALNFFQK